MYSRFGSRRPVISVLPLNLADFPPQAARAVEHAYLGVFSHEYQHAVDDARGLRRETSGIILFDLLQLSQDERYPDAAWAARQVLELRVPQGGFVSGEYALLLDGIDPAHFMLAVLELGVANDVTRLPDWFRDAYFPQRDPTVAADHTATSRPIRGARGDPAPADVGLRQQRVLDVMAERCGPVLPGATTLPKYTCSNYIAPTTFDGVPYPPMPGANGRGPAFPGAPSPFGPTPTTTAPPPSAPTPIPTATPPPPAQRPPGQGITPVFPTTPVVTGGNPTPVTAAVLNLPPTSPGASPDEGLFLAIQQVDDASLFYFVAGGERHAISETDARAITLSDPLRAIRWVSMDEAEEYPQTSAVGSTSG
jgi:hypothetical protein